MPMSNDEAHRARAVRPVSIVASGTDSLLDSLPVASGRARTRQLLKAKGVRVLRLSFDAGQVLGDRIESAAMLVQTLRGRVTLSVAGEDIDMPAGAIVHLERELPHSFAAVEASHLMITLLGPRLARPRATSHAPELSHPMLAVGSNGRRSVAGGTQPRAGGLRCECRGAGCDHTSPRGAVGSARSQDRSAARSACGGNRCGL